VYNCEGHDWYRVGQSGVLVRSMSKPTPQPVLPALPYVYLLTLTEKNLTIQQLQNQGYTDVRLPNGQNVRIVGGMAHPVFFNQTGRVHATTMQPLVAAQLPTISGLFLWGIVPTGKGQYQLRIALPATARDGHPELVDGWPVYAAGQVTVVNGTITDLNNQSGHYNPSAVVASFVETAFNAFGLNATGKYMELFP
jgi:hypothetical protein